MRLALFIYCIVGAAVLAAAIVLASCSAVRLQGQLKQAHTELVSATRDNSAVQDKLLQMQDQQRRDRALYSPQQAVQASFAVQEAQNAAQQATERLNKASVADTQLRADRDHYLIMLIPLGVFFFAHMLLAVMLRPRRGDTKPAWKRG